MLLDRPVRWVDTWGMMSGEGPSGKRVVASPKSSAGGGQGRASGEIDESAIQWSFVRSSGPGGQNVNKRATQAQLRVAIAALGLDAAGQHRLRGLEPHWVTADDEVVIACDETRSQRQNMERALDRLRELVARARVRPRVRRATKPTRGSVERRLASKREASQRKGRRQRPEAE